MLWVRLITRTREIPLFLFQSEFFGMNPLVGFFFHAQVLSIGAFFENPAKD